MTTPREVRHVRFGPLDVATLGALMDSLAPYAGHSTSSHVVRRAARRVRGEPLIGPSTQH